MMHPAWMITKNNDKNVLFIGLKVTGADYLAVKGGESPEDFHITLCYAHFRYRSDEEDMTCRIQSAIDKVRGLIPERIRFDAIDRFEASDSSDGKDVIFARVAPGQLEKAHDAFIKAMKEEGIQLNPTFPVYKPHMTLAYIDPGKDYKLSKINVTGKITKILIGHGVDSDASRENTFSIQKSDEDKRLVFGWANIAIRANGEQIEDLQGDIMDPEDLEEGVYQYVLNFRDAGEEHIPGLRKKARMVESVVFTNEKLQAMGIPAGTVPLGWWIGFYVDDDETWERIKDGTYKMFSIEGKGTRIPIKKSKFPRFTWSGLAKKNPYHDKKTGRFTHAPGGASKDYSEYGDMIRQGPPPKKTLIAYKVFCVKDGKLYPPMVANPGAKDTPMGVWLDAKEGVRAGESKTGRPQVKAGGKGTKGGGGKLAYRPGWHLGEIPKADQFYVTNKQTGQKEQYKNFVWAECEIAADKNYQKQAMSYGYTANGKFRHSYAGLPAIPTDGYYTYRTNPNPDTKPWYITGSMKVNRILTDAETDAILIAHGETPMPRQGGPLDLEALGINKSANMAKSFSDILQKFNPYHGPDGRFTTSGGAASFTYAPGKSKAHDNAIAREKERAAAAASGGNSEWNKKMDAEMESVLSMAKNKQALYLANSGMLDRNQAVEAMKNGTTEAYVRNYFAIMKQNGDTTSTKPLSDNKSSRNRDVDSGKYSSHDEAKKGYIKEKTGMNDVDAEKASKEITTWTSNSWSKADTTTLDRYIEKDHTYDGEIFRGMHFDDSDYSSFMSNIQSGSTISMKRNSSWSSDEADARIFAHTSDSGINSVVIKCVKNRTSSPISYLNSQGEKEVIAHSQASWTVLNVQTTPTGKGTYNTLITVVERGE